MQVAAAVLRGQHKISVNVRYKDKTHRDPWLAMTEVLTKKK